MKINLMTLKIDGLDLLTPTCLMGKSLRSKAGYP